VPLAHGKGLTERTWKRLLAEREEDAFIITGRTFIGA
jgi:hypothetical protein